MEKQERRECGKCSVCCKTLVIKDLKKPLGHPCEHMLDSGGCAIYSERWDICRKWYCTWMTGMIKGDERQRPDNLGVMFNIEVPPEGSVSSVGLDLYEVWPNAAQQPEVQEIRQQLLQKLRQTYPYMVTRIVPHDSKGPWFEEGHVMEFKEIDGELTFVRLMSRHEFQKLHGDSIKKNSTFVLDPEEIYKHIQSKN